MTRVDDESLALHLEVALSTAPPSMLGGLLDPDRRQRHAAIGEITRELVERLRCFDIRYEDGRIACGRQPALFPDDLGPISHNVMVARTSGKAAECQMVQIVSDGARLARLDQRFGRTTV
ncbi:hypothetical protein SAMN06295987_1011332 [Novosphingobium mathurense]|uniref:Uncharacterized protein n=1 Tax=Novosphingobium mathurense TaxID=428990 RepID=A0A1U6H5U4_9SPHN|nr:hypothetical protein SAMN06295987_1011332 [Novosphingobium mathurense]